MHVAAGGESVFRASSLCTVSFRIILHCVFFCVCVCFLFNKVQVYLSPVKQITQIADMIQEVCLKFIER